MSTRDMFFYDINNFDSSKGKTIIHTLHQKLVVNWFYNDSIYDLFFGYLYFIKSNKFVKPTRC